MLIFEMLKPSARQTAERQLHEAEREALKHAADYEAFTAAAEYSAAQVRMYQDRAARIKGVLKSESASAGA